MSCTGKKCALKTIDINSVQIFKDIIKLYHTNLAMPLLFVSPGIK